MKVRVQKFKRDPIESIYQIYWFVPLPLQLSYSLLLAFIAVCSVNAHTQLILPVLSGLGLSSLALGGAKFVGLAGITSGVVSSLGTLGLSRAIASRLARSDTDSVYYGGAEDGNANGWNGNNDELRTVSLVGGVDGYGFDRQDNARILQTSYVR